MRTLAFYRVEHARLHDGTHPLGPHSATMCDLTNQDAALAELLYDTAAELSWRHDDGHHPSWENTPWFEADGTPLPAGVLPGTAYYAGFLTVEDLTGWFSPYDLGLMAAAGFVLRRYQVPEGLVCVADGQAAAVLTTIRADQAWALTDLPVPTTAAAV